MRFISAITLFASLVAAQTTECPAASIVEACLASTGAILTSCPTNDWTCMCNAQKALLTCYDNCPQDARQPSANSVKIQYCQAAAQQNPSTIAAVVSATSSALRASSAASRASSAVSSAQTGAATAVVRSGSGILAVAIGVAALI